MRIIAVLFRVALATSGPTLLAKLETTAGHPLAKMHCDVVRKHDASNAKGWAKEEGASPFGMLKPNLACKLSASLHLRINQRVSCLLGLVACYRRLPVAEFCAFNLLQ